MKDGDDGTLSISGQSVVFSDGDLIRRIDRRQVVGVAVGDERAETGGIAGKAARMAVPYGGGAVIGAVSQKQVGFLTLDYRDKERGLHSAVFLLSKSDALEIANRLIPDSRLLNSPPHTAMCHGQNPGPTLQFMQIQSAPNVHLAPEYRAMISEHLLGLPEDKTHVLHIYRDGEQSAQCAGFVLSLTVEEFSKGNAAVRAETGPVGLFVGVTRVRAHLVLSDRSGKTVLDKMVKGSRRGDRESLNAAISVADSIAKDLKKAKLASPARNNL